MPVPTKLRHKKRQSLPSGRVLQLFSNTHLSNCTTSPGESASKGRRGSIRLARNVDLSLREKPSPAASRPTLPLRGLLI